MKYPCSLCGGGGTDTQCPECGETLPPNPLARALDAAQEVLEPVLHHPGVVVSNGRAKVYAGGQVVASVPVLGGDKVAAVRQVTEVALRYAHELADIQRDPDACMAALGIGRVA